MTIPEATYPYIFLGILIGWLLFAAIVWLVTIRHERGERDADDFPAEKTGNKKKS